MNRGNVDAFRWSPKNDRILYRAEQGVDECFGVDVSRHGGKARALRLEFPRQGQRQDLQNNSGRLVRARLQLALEREASRLRSSRIGPAVARALEWRAVEGTSPEILGTAFAGRGIGAYEIR